MVGSTTTLGRLDETHLLSYGTATTQCGVFSWVATFSLNLQLQPQHSSATTTATVMSPVKDFFQQR